MPRPAIQSQTIQTGAGLGLLTLIPLLYQVRDQGLHSLTELQWGQVSAVLILLWGNIHGRLKAGGLSGWLPRRKRHYQLSSEEQRQAYQALRAENQHLKIELGYARQALNNRISTNLNQPTIHQVPHPEASQD